MTSNNSKPIALSYMVGNISIYSPLVTSPVQVFRSLMAGQAICRPTYTGTGVLTLQSSLGRFHVLELSGESWILESGTFWAAQGELDVSFYRERFLTALWCGQGLMYLQTLVSGHGKVALATRGPVEEVVLGDGESFVAEAGIVICRSARVHLTAHCAPKKLRGQPTFGQSGFRKYVGPGKILLNSAPYWRYRLASEQRGASGKGFQFIS